MVGYGSGNNYDVVLAPLLRQHNILAQWAGPLHTVRRYTFAQIFVYLLRGRC